MGQVQHATPIVLSHGLFGFGEVSLGKIKFSYFNRIDRALKQTMGRRRLLCGSPAAATAELDWAVVGLWLLGLISVGRLAAAGQAPDRWGVAASLRAVRRAIGVVAAAARCRPCRRRTPSLGDELARATKDAYARRGPRRARDWPHKKRDRPPGDPRARNASESEVALAAELRSKGAAA